MTLQVLIVEDCNSDATLMCRHLRQAGLTLSALCVANADDFRSALDRQRWDVVLSDYALPSFNGRAALDIVRGGGLDVPFIVVSGHLSEETAVELMKAGAQDFFSKANLTRLAAAVAREVAEADARRQYLAERARAEEERRRLVQELEEAVRIRDAFLTLAAHELRTPLTAAQLQVDRLRKGAPSAGADPPERLAQSLALIARLHWRLSALVDNFLAVASMIPAERRMTLEPVDLGELVEEALEALEEEVRASGSAISVRAEPRIIGQWNRALVRTVVSNLLGNAVKFGEGRPIVVLLAVESGRAELTVADRGVGISSAEQARIFDKFASIVVNHHQGGFGLGLWLVRRIAEAHGGTVSVTSRPAEGSTFTIELPLRPPEPAPVAGARTN